MAITLAFDVYGTLVDTNGITDTLRKRVGDRAPAVAKAWRDKQLEYAFRRTVMGDFADFADCISDALDFTLRVYSVSLSAAERERLLEAYQRLPAFLDAEPGMEDLQQAGYRAFAFSNASRETVSKLLGDNSLRQYFEDVVSAESVAAFKPSPQVYAAFLSRVSTPAEQTWLISGNQFDIIGARSVGWQAIWVRRLPNVVYDPWGLEPNATVSTLTELPRVLPAP
ncbi:haloacid dehalogenase type II [Halorhodospira halochloris]|uniref:(S)-2-haloacid dehalogenase n=1 Tax=Halorhodospira halochloris TaxID=1052 RepID=A0A120MZZ2_HALHR|nr:haloacid dehalogenase type II [Halorhodospira halochloris]MBK1651937.1 haloacid dehalogenase type II [Halorhodospira halochloris]MCG5530362.1 haloacid dehalogenase type II [Halorhodospira halochloris]BAU58228.1 haloacid dehalogenase [Halorhodospira halochloris]